MRDRHRKTARGSRGGRKEGRGTRSPRRRKPAAVAGGRRGRTNLVVLAVAALLGALYGPRLVGATAGALIRTQVVRAGSVERTVVGHGFFLREDEVVVAPVSGTLEWLVPDGERVRAGTAVARLANPDARAELLRRLSAIDRDIAAWDTKNQASRARMEAELTAANRTVLELVTAWRERLMRKPQEDRDGGVSPVAAAAEHRQVVVFKLTTLDEERALLAKEREAVAGLLRRAVLDTTSPVAGVVSRQFDGLEESLELSVVPLPDSARLLASQPKPYEARVGDKVMPGQRLFRVTDMSRIGVAVVMSDREMAQFAPNQEVTIRMGERPAEIAATVGAVGEREKTGSGVVLLVTSEATAELARSRQAKVTVTLRSARGPALAKSCLVTRSGVTGVYVIERGRTAFRPVTVVAASPTQAVVSGLAIGDEVVTNPWLVFGKGVAVR
jgi:putative membrane fusion protein